MAINSGVRAGNRQYEPTDAPTSISTGSAPSSLSCRSLKGAVRPVREQPMVPESTREYPMVPESTQGVAAQSYQYDSTPIAQTNSKPWNALTCRGRAMPTHAVLLVGRRMLRAGGSHGIGFAHEG
jgi:hypothetical protein